MALLIYDDATDSFFSANARFDFGIDKRSRAVAADINGTGNVKDPAGLQVWSGQDLATDCTFYRRRKPPIITAGCPAEIVCMSNLRDKAARMYRDAVGSRKIIGEKELLVVQE